MFQYGHTGPPTFLPDAVLVAGTEDMFAAAYIFARATRRAAALFEAARDAAPRAVERARLWRATAKRLFQLCLDAAKESGGVVGTVHDWLVEHPQPHDPAPMHEMGAALATALALTDEALTALVESSATTDPALRLVPQQHRVAMHQQMCALHVCWREEYRGVSEAIRERSRRVARELAELELLCPRPVEACKQRGAAPPASTVQLASQDWAWSMLEGRAAVLRAHYRATMIAPP
jgi:hypothetical protein